MDLWTPCSRNSQIYVRDFEPFKGMNDWDVFGSIDLILLLFSNRHYGLISPFLVFKPLFAKATARLHHRCFSNPQIDQDPAKECVGPFGTKSIVVWRNCESVV